MGQQLTGEEIRVYMKDSTIDHAHVISQAFSIQMLHDSVHFNQISSKEMTAFFEDGNIRRAISSGNVRAIYYPIDEKDTSIIVMDYTETDTMKMYFSPERKLEKIWMPKGRSSGKNFNCLCPSRQKTASPSVGTNSETRRPIRLPERTRLSLRNGASVTPSMGLRIVFGKTSRFRSLKLFNILTTPIHKNSATRTRKNYLISAGLVL